jgi:RimJ/RimL family protein N-acetyltransferase
MAQVAMFETQRLIIRPFDDTDAGAIFSLVYACPEVRDRWTNFRGTLAEFEHGPFQTGRNWRIRDGFGYWALVRKLDDSMIGLMGFQNHAHEDMQWLVMPGGMRDVGRIPGRIDAELTYALGKSYWGAGYAREAGHFLIDYGFRILGIDRIINAIDKNNVRSYELMKRLGFRFVDNGNPDDVIGVLERQLG